MKNRRRNGGLERERRFRFAPSRESSTPTAPAGMLRGAAACGAAASSGLTAAAAACAAGDNRIVVPAREQPLQQAAQFAPAAWEQPAQLMAARFGSGLRSGWRSGLRRWRGSGLHYRRRRGCGADSGAPAQRVARVAALARSGCTTGGTGCGAGSGTACTNRRRRGLWRWRLLRLLAASAGTACATGGVAELGVALDCRGGRDSTGAASGAAGAVLWIDWRAARRRGMDRRGSGFGSQRAFIPRFRGRRRWPTPRPARPNRRDLRHRPHSPSRREKCAHRPGAEDESAPRGAAFQPRC